MTIEQDPSAVLLTVLHEVEGLPARHIESISVLMSAGEWAIALQTRCDQCRGPNSALRLHRPRSTDIGTTDSSSFRAHKVSALPKRAELTTLSIGPPVISDSFAPGT